MNENMNNMNMNSNFQNNQNMNMNQEFYINEEINKNVIPGVNNLELNKNQNNDNNPDNEIKKTCLETDFGIDINNHIFLLISKYSPLALIVFVILNTFELLSKFTLHSFSFIIIEQ